MAWPVSQDYNEAIQSPTTNFADADLRCGGAVTNALGLPMPFSGNFADVYEVRTANSRWAVKCFTRESPALRERYTEISRHLRQAKLPFTVDFNYLEQGIRVAGRWYPVVKMNWVEGLTLNQFVNQYVDKATTLDALLQLWTRMARYLRGADVGHCDLQHGNILLVPGAGSNSLALKLIDYDGVWVPSLAGGTSGEVGHPAYQHPLRIRKGTYSREVDRFPMLLIATALCALKATGRQLWQKYDNGDNLLFKEADLREPTQSELFRELAALPDASTSALLGAVRKALDSGLESAPLLEELLSDTRTHSGSRAAMPSAAAAPAAAMRPRSSKPSKSPGPSAFGDFDEVTPVSVAEKWVENRSRSRRTISVAAVALLATLAVVSGAAGIVYVSMQAGSEKTVVGPTGPEVLQPTEINGPGPAPKKRGASDVDNGVLPAVVPGSDSKPAKDVGLDRDTTQHTPGVGEGGPKPAVGQPPVDLGTFPTKPVVNNSDSKPPVPNDMELAVARKQAKETYKADYAKGKRDDLLALARRLLKDGIETKDKLALRYFLLHEAGDLAAQLGDLPFAIRAADETAEHFHVSGTDLKAAELELASQYAVSPADHMSVMLFALAVADDALEQNAYETAERLLNVAKSSAATTGNSALKTLAQERAKEFASSQTAYEAVADAVRTLATKPADPDANGAVGSYYAFAKGDWDRALSHLRIGNDAKLKGLAASDLAVPPDATGALNLGDRYAAQAETEKEPAKSQLLNRASYWYEIAEVKSTAQARPKISKKRVDFERHLTTARPIILHAHYGASGRWDDVTAILRCHLSQAPGAKLTPRAIDFGNDPAVGEQKSVVVVYRFRGALRVGIAAGQNTPGVPGNLAAEPGRLLPGQDLSILCAQYGNEGTYIDVTAKVQAAVKGTNMAASPAQLGFTDPIPGRRKALIVVYRQGDRIRLSITAEESVARLGGD